MTNEIKYIEGDLFKGLSETERILLPHICNNRRAWGAGFVLPLGHNFPAARDAYLNWASSVTLNPFELGRTQFVEIKESLSVANMVAQTLGGKRPLFYNHLAVCMEDVAQYAINSKSKIICPMFGSGLAGGDWNFIEKLIEDSWLKRGLNVTVYYLADKLPGNWSPPIGEEK